MKETLFGKTLDELREVAATLGMPRHAAGQMAAWIYRRGVREIGAMTDISAVRREALAERFDVGLSAPLREAVSVDGTKKYLFSTAEGGRVESAMIPDRGRSSVEGEGSGEGSGERATLCVSSQAGCRMGCAFCATGRQGLAHNLTAGDILNQFASLPEREALTNIVYMGMGEPLDNPDAVMRSLEILTAEWGYGWSPTRVTLSTAGVIPAMERFLSDSRVHLAVSLHNPFADERAAIMPIERAYPIERVVEAIRRHDFSGQRRVSFEYIVMSGINDSSRHIAGLTKLLNGLSCRVNLIRFHKIPDSPYFSPPMEKMEWFRDALSRKGVRTTIRASRGEDIAAACGLLSTSQIEN
ncbi:MAG: 23S rRNA (adenine(2503)-C(2))-methyltransferase RlmN [Alistipes sp.]|jgi:23S rRNA (adenine2503-C2)-methyltransferase|nr:23S rRNA (adenine(2503)-C(2))-methyltransferase RlmN [Alistipes sp.]